MSLPPTVASSSLPGASEKGLFWLNYGSGSWALDSEAHACDIGMELALLGHSLPPTLLTLKPPPDLEIQ
jgi:hypothetical protein